MKRRPTDRKAARPAARKLTDFLVACAAEADPRERIRMAREALHALPRDNHQGQMAVRALMAHALVDAGDLDSARKEWLKVAAGKGGRARARIEAGILAESAGRFDVAEGDYRAAVSAGENLQQKAEAVAVLARFLVRRGTPEKALALLRKASVRLPEPLLKVAQAFVEARIARDPTPLLRWRRLMESKQKSVPLYGYFLGFLNLWDGRTVEALKTLRGFISRGVDQDGAWGRELSPELDHARRTILQIDAAARVPMP